MNIDNGKLDDLKIIMVHLGWRKWNGDIWQNRNGLRKNFIDAVLWELGGFAELQKQLFICPDCSYKVTFQEFVTSTK